MIKMEVAIISSSRDLAGKNIRQRLVERFPFEKTSEKFLNNEAYKFNSGSDTISLYQTDSELIFSDNIGKEIEADIMIFASKHRSKENTKSFAVHAIGNWNKAETGGKEKTLCLSSSHTMKKLLVHLNENFDAMKSDNSQLDGYELTMEATHHGPHVEKPAAFVEIGSTEQEWTDPINGELIAKTILDSLSDEENNFKSAIGIGGPNYCSNFNKIMFRTGIAISHVCPKYMLQFLDEGILKQAIEKTKEKIDFILLDWKGLGSEKQRILEMINSLGLEYRRTDKLKE